jgi:hypothetical protein
MYSGEDMNSSLKNDVLKTVGNIHSLNNPNAIGYVFNATSDERNISEGMYINSLTEITDNPERWDYFVDKKCNIKSTKGMIHGKNVL